MAHTAKPIVFTVNENGCHVCVSHTCNQPYPLIHRKGKMLPLYREVYCREKGEIPDGQVVRHTCDNTRCINPEHLILGTHADNVADRVRRNRSARGTKNGRAKLTPEQVEFARNSAETNSQIARRFGVDTRAIGLIRSELDLVDCLNLTRFAVIHRKETLTWSARTTRRRKLPGGFPTSSRLATS